MSQFDVKGHSSGRGTVWGSGHSLGSGVTVWGQMTISKGPKSQSGVRGFCMAVPRSRVTVWRTRLTVLSPDG